MRTCTALLCLAFGVPAVAADKPEDLAREAAVSFLKAVKAKDLDAMMKAADVPFAYREGSLTTHKDADSLKKWLAGKLDELKDPDKVPTSLSDLHTFESIKDRIKDAADRTLAEEVMGKDGYVGVVTSEDGKNVGIPVRVRDGKARVVGLILR